MFAAVSEREDAQRKSWAEIPVKLEAAAVDGTIGLEVGIRVQDMIGSFGNLAQVSKR